MSGQDSGVRQAMRRTALSTAVAAAISLLIWQGAARAQEASAGHGASASGAAAQVASADDAAQPAAVAADAQPASAQPADARPANAEPADAQSADPQPANVQPAAQSADTPPAGNARSANTPPADAQPTPADGRSAIAQSAASQPGVAPDNVQVQDRVVVTGTRTATRASRSLTPVDVISGQQLQATGKDSLRDALTTLSPSIQSENYPGDTALLTDALTLHGLSPDHVLVLVNGKRRHTTANISQDQGPQTGSTGVDVSLIPVGLIDHVEILRDAAAAQYGSDAIAGVINIILKSGAEGGSIQNTTGQTYQGDGLSENLSLTKAFNLGDKGFFDLSAEYNRHNHTLRTGFDDYFGALPGGIANPIDGDPSSTRYAVGYNAGYNLDDDVQLYSFGTYAHRTGAAYQNSRPPFVLPQVWANGFVPQETINENDYAVTVGVKGKNLLGWTWDLSSTYGGDHEGLGLVDSANTGLYAATGYTPTNFRLGTQGNTQWTNTLDVSRPFHFLLPEPVTVSAGIEQRRETYSIGAGDPSSWQDGGSQAITGYLPSSSGAFARNVLGAYVDLSGRFTPKWRFDLSGRYDHYSDAGSTTNGKFATRYDFSPAIGVRGSVSTGFRAPSLAEQYLTNLTISPVTASGLLAANSPAAQLIGASPLKPEQSTNYNLGLVLHPASNLNVTLDAYQINIRNRIVLGGTAAGQSAIDAIAAAGISLPGVPANAVSANYFTNGANTRTRGLDLVATYRTDLGRYGRVDWDLALNLNTTSVTRIANGANGQPQLNQQQVGWLTTSTPKNKLILGGNWHYDKWGVSVHEVRYGPTTSYLTYYAGPNAFSTTRFQYFRNAPLYVTDVEVRYDVSKKFQIALGANNLFNAHPGVKPYDTQLEGNQYDEAGAQITPTGGFYYLRARYLF